MLAGAHARGGDLLTPKWGLGVGSYRGRSTRREIHLARGTAYPSAVVSKQNACCKTGPCPKVWLQLKHMERGEGQRPDQAQDPPGPTCKVPSRPSVPPPRMKVPRPQGEGRVVPSCQCYLAHHDQGQKEGPGQALSGTSGAKGKGASTPAKQALMPTCPLCLPFLQLQRSIHCSAGGLPAAEESSPEGPGAA